MFSDLPWNFDEAWLEYKYHGKEYHDQLCWVYELGSIVTPGAWEPSDCWVQYVYVPCNQYFEVV